MLKLLLVLCLLHLAVSLKCLVSSVQKDGKTKVSSQNCKTMDKKCSMPVFVLYTGIVDKDVPYICGACKNGVAANCTECVKDDCNAEVKIKSYECLTYSVADNVVTANDAAQRCYIDDKSKLSCFARTRDSTVTTPDLIKGGCGGCSIKYPDGACTSCGKDKCNSALRMTSLVVVPFFVLFWTLF